MRVPCVSFTPKGDSDYEKCDSFCDARYAATHCSMCRCRGCSYCDDVEMCDPRKRTDCACEPATSKDSHVMQVRRDDHRTDHTNNTRGANVPVSLLWRSDGRMFDAHVGSIAVRRLL
jgi:hypothetical protein